MIARHDRLGTLGDQLEAGQRVGAVADGVAQAEHGVDLPGAVGEDGAQSFEVAVHVGEDRVSQEGRCSFRIRSSRPLMNRLDSAVPNFLASSMASLMATLGGTSGCHRSSWTARSKMLLSTTAMRSRSHCWAYCVMS